MEAALKLVVPKPAVVVACSFLGGLYFLALPGAAILDLGQSKMTVLGRARKTTRNILWCLYEFTKMHRLGPLF